MSVISSFELGAGAPAGGVSDRQGVNRVMGHRFITGPEYTLDEIPDLNFRRPAVTRGREFDMGGHVFDDFRAGFDQGMDDRAPEFRNPDQAGDVFVVKSFFQGGQAGMMLADDFLDRRTYFFDLFIGIGLFGPDGSRADTFLTLNYRESRSGDAGVDPDYLNAFRTGNVGNYGRRSLNAGGLVRSGCRVPGRDNFQDPWLEIFSIIESGMSKLP